MRFFTVLALAGALAIPVAAAAQNDAAAIKAVMQKSADDWNHGDMVEEDDQPRL
jgi:hypothetical protein